MVSNTFLFEKENHFIRQSADRFRARGHHQVYNALTDILLAQPRDSYVVEQLLTAGYLEKNAGEHVALHMLWILERTGYWH